MIVVMGNSWEIKDDLKSRFKMSFDWDNKIWYRPHVDASTLWWWEDTIKSLSKNVDVAWVVSMGAVAEMKKIKEIEKASPRTVENAKAHELDGSVMEVKAWYARKFKEEHNTGYAFRNLKVLKILKETERAYQMDVEFFGGIASSCGCCGRDLDNAVSKAVGIGPICAEKIGLPRPTLETAKEILEELEKKSKAQGVFNGVWIPKSQVKTKTEV